jgi:transglutaminase-like putative cysteine protease
LLNREIEVIKRVFVFFIVFFSLFAPGIAWGKLHYYSGTMNSKFEMKHTYTIIIPAGISSFTYITTPPDNYSLPNNTQNITERKYSFSVTPSVEDYTDIYGNDFKKFTWANPRQGTITMNVSYTVTASSDWNNFVTSDKFPFDRSGLPDSITDYIKPSNYVQSDHPLLINLANSLTSGLTTQWEALKALNGWVMDNIFYGTNPYGYDALSTFALKYGNCSNYAHIALALVRAAGIPARLTHGYSLTKPYSLPTGGDPVDANWGQGTHAWIEVYYPSLGWVPYDPQRDLHHVDTHRVLWGRGPDSMDIVGDISWTFSSVPSGYPTAYQSLNVNWIEDTIALSFIKSTSEIYSESFSSKVTFVKAYTVNASASNGGSISPVGQTTVHSGEDLTFTITPDSEFYLSDVFVDGVSKGQVSSYTFTNITADHTIAARFLLADSDEDTIPDWWEQDIIDYDLNDAITAFNNVLPEDDFDGDNFSNMKEYQKETDPTDADSHPPRTMPWLMLLLDD